MPPHLQLAMAMGTDHRNQYLFSDHYLNQLLPQDPRWEQALPQAQSFWTWVQHLYAREQGQLADYNEAQLEEHWFKPILEKLGHVFERQASVPGLDVGIKRPDYVLFPHEGARQAAVGAQSSEAYTAQALAVGEVKRWDTPLGKKRRGGGASFEDQNPSVQIDYYVRATDLDWGILTNGRLWRLVHRDTSQRLSIYYEVDLVDLLERGDGGAMRYFTLFFRQAALRAGARGRVFLDDALAASNAYAVELEEDLEQNVYHALERLMQGFLDLPHNGLGGDDVRQVYDNSLYLLYRLLFILYGESRGLLPLDNDQYRTNYSLNRIKGEIAGLEVTPAPRTTLYWGQLQNLFHIINGDDAELNRSLGVPRYNGGLFDPQRHPFLEEKQVGDRALVEAIDLLSRRTTQAGREFADYRTLGVRHLGSIYEGLLEYQPRYATEPMVAVRDNKGEQWVRAAEASDGVRVVDRRDAGQVYLETDRGERKATGSYYTPQYIVAYIVEHTLGPLVEEARERVRARAREARGRAARSEAEQSLVEEILGLKCLDPAMGSGHFLVEATEFLALALATDPYVETETSAEEDLTHWKRRVVERCIYGVDKNPLAVELAKLSLWLATVAADRPLSFLDHHLKCGDSLVGARVEDLGQVPVPEVAHGIQRQGPQPSPLLAGGTEGGGAFPPAREGDRGGAALPPAREGDRGGAALPPAREGDRGGAPSRLLVGGTEEGAASPPLLVGWTEGGAALPPACGGDRGGAVMCRLQAMADLWTSAYFGNEFINGEYDEALMHIGQPEALMTLPAVQRARAIAKERHFFHWELAFPEVFYDERGQRLRERAGFDAVVGNPPYVTTLDPHERGYFFDWSETRGRELDTFYLFVEQALRLLRRAAWCSMIVSNVLLLQAEAEALRRYLLRHTILELCDHGFSVFEQATVPSATFVVRKSPPSDGHAIRVRLACGEERAIKQDFFSTLPAAQFNAQIVETLPVLEEIEAVSAPLATYAESHEGIHSGNIRAKLFTRQPRSSCARKMLKGADIGRYSLSWGGWYVHYDASRIDRAGGDYASLREERIFTVPKVWTRQTGDSIIATWDDQGFYGDNTLHSTQLRPDAQIAPLYLVAVLNSQLLTFVYQERTRERGRPLAQVKIIFLRQLPIYRVEFTIPADEREELVASGITEATEWIESAAGSSVDSVTFSAFSGSNVGQWVDARLSTDPQPGSEAVGPQSDVVHDLLAHLAERMIDMHKQKQERVEAFWLDLEGVTDAETFDVLRNKGKWESSLWKAEVCRPFVDQESRSTRHLDESLGWNEDCFKAFVNMLAGKVSNLSNVVGVYRKHHPAYRALVARIAATDRLIDLIVYRLYGLTEEEVAIVEGER